MEHNRLFGTLSPTKLFFRCAVPSMISMAVTSLYVVADGIFVGRYIGADALAAVNLVMPFIMISFALSDMVAIGSSVQMAIRLGEKRNLEASRIFSFASGMIVVISVVVGSAAFFLADNLVALMGADPVVTGYAAAYMRVYALFSPATMLFFAVDNFLRICGKVQYSMGMNVLLSVGNILLDWLFIVQFGWGVASAALASCLSLAVGTCVGYLPFLRGKLALRFMKARLPISVVGNILANGCSEFFSNISSSIFMVIINTVLLRISGALAVAAFSIVLYVDSIVKSIIFGMSDALQPAISYNYGAQNRRRVLALEGRLLCAGAFISISVMLWMLFGGRTLISLFVHGDDPALLEMSLRAMHIFSFSYLTCWFGIIASSFFTALNRAALSLVIAFGQALVFPLAALAVLPHFWGLDGVWATAFFATTLAALLAAIFLIATMRSLKNTLPEA